MIIRRRGIARTMARTAVVAGTATAVSNRVNRRMNNSAQAAEPTPQQEVEAPQARNVAAELQELSTLKAQGALSEAEYQAAKEKVLTS